MTKTYESKEDDTNRAQSGVLKKIDPHCSHHEECSDLSKQKCYHQDMDKHHTKEKIFSDNYEKDNTIVKSSPSSVQMESTVREPSWMHVDNRVMEKAIKSKARNAYPVLYSNSCSHDINEDILKTKMSMKSTRSGADDREAKIKAKMETYQRIHSDHRHHVHLKTADTKSKFYNREAKLKAKSGIMQQDQVTPGSKRKLQEAMDFHGTILENFCDDNSRSNIIAPEGLGTVSYDDCNPSCATKSKQSISSFASKSTLAKNSGVSLFTDKSKTDPPLHLAVAKEVDPSIDDDPIYEASYYEPDETPARYRTRRCQIYTAIILFLIAILITLGVVYFIKKGKERSPPVTYIPEPRSQSREGFIANTLLKGQEHNFEKLEKEDSRRLAYEWILYNDTKKVDLNSPNLLTQRYVLAVLAFQLDISAWTFCGTQSNAKDKCFVETDDFVMKKYSRWLVGTDECKWYGVSCYENGSVRELLLRT